MLPAAETFRLLCSAGAALHLESVELWFMSFAMEADHSRGMLLATVTFVAS